MCVKIVEIKWCVCVWGGGGGGGYHELFVTIFLGGKGSEKTI